MDIDDLRLILLEFIEESRAKEGLAVGQEPSSSNLDVVVRGLATAKSLTPTQRHAIATARHIDDVCKERDRLIRELAATHESHAVAIRELRRDLTVIIASHRDRLDWFEPHYEALKRDYNNIKSLNLSSLSLITAGGVVIGLASFLPSDVLKFSALAAGSVASIIGLWTQWVVVSKSPLSKERPAR